ncbi:MAG: hypothetical protein NTX79_04560 [Candidatus Micrarchaeota archaeon]|nr:hypothetical protein [Candidatus Micrarchaeota archaeon]
MVENTKQNQVPGAKGERNASGLNDRLQPKALLTDGIRQDNRKITKEEFGDIVVGKPEDKLTRSRKIFWMFLNRDTNEAFLTEESAQSCLRIVNLLGRNERGIRSLFDLISFEKSTPELLPILEKIAEKYNEESSFCNTIWQFERIIKSKVYDAPTTLSVLGKTVDSALATEAPILNYYTSSDKHTKMSIKGVEISPPVITASLIECAVADFCNIINNAAFTQKMLPIIEKIAENTKGDGTVIALENVLNSSKKA